MRLTIAPRTAAPALLAFSLLTGRHDCRLLRRAAQQATPTP